MFPLLSALAAGCGDDGGSSSPTTDAGDKGNTSLDAGTQKPPTIPRRDAQVSDTPDPITPCERGNPNSCPAGEVCDLLIRPLPNDTRFGVLAGCVTASRERAEGDPCNPDLTQAEQYTAPGLKDPVFRDPCGPGLVCSPNRKVRGAYSCQTACSSGELVDSAFGCEDPTSLCVQGTQVGEYCRKADGCSVDKQTGCSGGEACYLLPSGDRKQLLSICTPAPMMATADGAPGCAPNSCNPGSVCLGPVRMPIASWTNANVTCRPVCNGQSGEAPAGDEDAGLPSGLCSTTTRCEPYSASGLLLSSITAPPFGQCEAQ